MSGILVEATRAESRMRADQAAPVAAPRLRLTATQRTILAVTARLGVAANADQVQADLNRPREATKDYAAIAALKQIMAARTGDRTWITLRPPLINLSQAAADELLAKFAAA